MITLSIYIFRFSSSSISHKQRNVSYSENSTASERSKTPLEPVISTISSMIEFSDAGNIEYVM